LGDTDVNSDVTIRNCSFEGMIDAWHTAGGLIGRLGTSRGPANSVLIENCTVSGLLVTAGSELGGMIGKVNVAYSCIIKDCFNEAFVTGSMLAGGAVGTVISGDLSLYNFVNVGTVFVDDGIADPFVASGYYQGSGCMDLSPSLE